MPGTAVEKIVNVPYKYRNITKHKPMIIVLIAYQEEDNQGVFAEDERQQDYTKLWKSMVLIS